MSIQLKQLVTNLYIAWIFVCVLFGFLLLLPRSMFAATGDIIAVRIVPHSAVTDGWVAEIDIEGLETGGTYDFGLGTNNDPSLAKVVFTVNSPGFDQSGNATILTRTVYGTKQLRLPYPDEALNDESVSGGILTVKVALSDFIFNEDSNITVDINSGFYTKNSVPSNAVSGFSVTNNSSLAYPKVIGRWAWPGYERITDNFLVEAVAFHQSARMGKPIAVMVFEARDQSGNIVYATTTEMIKSTRTGDANAVLVYAATIPVSTLTQGEIITINFKAYPWIGNSSAVLNSDLVENGGDGYAQPSERLGPLYQLNDKEQGYGIGYTMVSNSGNDSTGTVYSTQAEAEAGNAFLTIGAAGTALKAYHNTNFGRNSAGGGVIVLAEGSYNYIQNIPSADLGSTMDTWMIIKRTSVASKINTIINAGAHTSTIKATKIKIEDLTLATTSNGFITGRSATDILWLHNNDINLTGTYSIYNFLVAYGTQNTISNFNLGFSPYAGKTPFAIVRGNLSSTNKVRSSVYSVLGNKNITGGDFAEIGANRGAHSDNSIFAFNEIKAFNDTLTWAHTSKLSHGMAVVQNVFESNSVNAYPILTLSASATSSTNIIVWNNTFAGERENFGYNSTGVEAHAKMLWNQRHNIFHEWNYKGDVFIGDEPNGNRVGGWPISYKIGYSSNISQEDNFPGDFKGLFYIWGPSSPTLDVSFIDNRSLSGAGGGNGDYNLNSTSVAIDLATSTTAILNTLPYDFLGNPIYGSRDAGAYEYQPTYTMGTDGLPLTSSVRVYGNDKFRRKSTPTNSDTATLAISIPGDDTSVWLDIDVNTWETTGSRLKNWTESSVYEGLNGTIHVVGDLSPNKPYSVKVDNVLGSNVVGEDCNSGICVSNGSGLITFTYTGTYSEHEFEVEEYEDITPPTVTNFTIPATSDSLTVPVSSFVATDNIGVTGYLITETQDVPSIENPAWSAVAQTTYIFSSNGEKTLYAWAKDSADNISASLSSTVAVGPTESQPSNDTNVDSSISSSGTSAFHILPIMPQGGFKVYINNGASTTSNRNVSLSFDAGANVRKMIISMTGDFTDAVQEDYVASKRWDLCSKYSGLVRTSTCPDGIYVIYVRFYTAHGRTFDSAIASSTIILKRDTVSQGNTQIANKFFSQLIKPLKYGQTDIGVKYLQIFLNSDPDTRLTDYGVGSPGRETNYFGTLTLKAVIKFQEKYSKDILSPLGLINGTGYVGNATIAKINEFINR